MTTPTYDAKRGPTPTAPEPDTVGSIPTPAVAPSPDQIDTLLAREGRAPRRNTPAREPATTGIPIVDGMRCETDGDQGGCELTETKRTRLLLALTVVVRTAMDNFRDAIQNLRIELLTTIKTESAWNGLVEVLFQGLSGGLIGMLGKSLGAFKTTMAGKVFDGVPVTVGGIELSERMVLRISHLKTKHVTGVLTSASKGLRTTLKNASHYASGQNDEKAQFLKIIQEGLAPLTNQLLLESPAALTDAELVAMEHSYEDMTYHSIGAYESDLRDLLDRFGQQEIASIGVSRSNGIDAMATKQAVHVVARGRRRMAIVEFFDKAFAGPIPTKLYDDKLVPWETTQFVSWIDGDLEPAALEYQTERFTDAPTILASDGKTGIRQIDEWAVSE